MIRTIELGADALSRLGSSAGVIDGPIAVGQLSRRMLAIHAVLTAVEEEHTELFQTARLDESRRVLAQAQRADRAGANAMLRLPTVGAWAMLCGYRLSSRPAADEIADDIGHFGAVAAVAALRAGLPFEVTVRVRADGTLMLPALGLARLGTGPTWIRARSTDGLGLELLGPEQLGHPIRPGNPETDRWSPLRQLRSTADGLTIALYLDDIDPYRGRHLPPVADRLAADEVSHWGRQLDEAWAAIVRRQPDEARALSAGMAALVPLKHDPRAPSVSATAKHAVGAMGVTRPHTPDALAEALVHEHRHSLLWAILDVVQLVDDESPALLYAPWRSDPRPALGLLHGAFAFLGLLRYWAAGSTPGGVDSQRSAAFELALWRQGVRTAIDQLTEPALLTPQGRALIEGMRSSLAEMETRAVPDDLQTMAEHTAMDLRITWRIGNCRPTQDSVKDCCAAWRAGLRRPELPPGTLIADGARFAGTSRLALLRRHIAGAGLVAATNPDGVATADLRLLTGDWSQAAELYATALATGQESTEAWAGLVLAWHALGRVGAEFLTVHPEHLPAVYACVAECSGTTPDVIELTKWFGSGSER